MSQEEDLRPLDARSAGETPEPLVRALRALGRQQPSPAALRATAAALEARIQAGAPPATPDVYPSVASKWLGTRMIAAALAVGLGAGAIALRQARTEPAAPSATASSPTTPSIRSAPAAVARPTPEVASAAQPALPGATSPASPLTSAPRAALPSAAAEQAPANAKGRPSPERTRGQVAATGLKRTTASPPSVPAKPSVARAASRDEAVQSPRPVVPASELELMLQARKLAHADPAAALSVVAEHARRFPRGQLAPEREVLAIDALRALGKNEQADARLRRFRASYPDSVYTPSLSQGAR